ncbi:protein farnesyltransferase subunit beta-like isoform X2 [Humulus lupulus]|nr:protein farnesyltransferase subunit beta-like isoform X2 [Humulus lupulus]
MPHLAKTYAAVNSLITIGGHEALSSINRSTLYMFLQRMKQPSGGFRMHDGGEIDVRACYTAISVTSILNILDDELVQNVGNYILSCQTYEGGIGGEPNSEAHGGYTFCGLATMILINEVHRLDLSPLIDWLVFRQGGECGFQGRTNKLVDGCYSFWQGGSFALLRRVGSFIDEQLMRPDDVGRCSTSTVSDIPEQGGLNASFHVNYNDIGHNFITTCPVMEHLFNSHALQQYILLCTQVVLKENLVLTLFRDEYILLHEEYQLYVLPRILESKRTAKSGRTKQKEADLEYSVAKKVEKMIRYIEMISLEQFLTTFVVEAFRMEECISLIFVYISCFEFSDKGI